MRWATVAVLALATSAVHGEEDVDCKGMRTKQLRQWLAARGLKCDGCAEKADFVALCESNRDAPLVEPPSEPASSDGGPRVRTPGSDKDASIEELLKSMKGMPGMENIKMFSGDDLKNLNPETFNAPGGSRPPPKKSTAEYRQEIVDFYTKYGLDDKVAGVDAALEKWKGREHKMMPALYKKYADEVAATDQADEVMKGEL